MAIIDRWVDGVLREQWDETARVLTSWDEHGVQVEQRPYTAQENTAADARAVVETLAANEKSISAKLANDLAAMQAILDQTNADLNAGPAQELKDLAKAVRRLIRKVERILDDTE